MRTGTHQHFNYEENPLLSSFEGKVVERLQDLFKNSYIRPM